MLTVSIDTQSHVPIYEQIIGQIRAAIRSGRLGPGAALPPVRQLAGELEINPNTVAKAYLLLERDGLIRTLRRRGCFVAEDADRRLQQRSDQHLAETLDRLVSESAQLGISGPELLQALARRLQGPEKELHSKQEGRSTGESPSGGASR